MDLQGCGFSGFGIGTVRGVKIGHWDIDVNGMVRDVNGIYHYVMRLSRWNVAYFLGKSLRRQRVSSKSFVSEKPLINQGFRSLLDDTSKRTRSGKITRIKKPLF